MTLDTSSEQPVATASSELVPIYATPDPYIIEALDRWSGSFTRFLLPSGLGSKAVITRCEDEGAKVLSMGIYIGYRTAKVELIPYDGRTYEGHTVRDESTGTLWAYETDLPKGFESKRGEKFLVSLGHISKCSTCRGQGRVRCSSCGGKIRWTKEKFDGDIVEVICSCGDGKMNCYKCTGYGEMLKVLRVETKYSFDKKKEKEYSGQLPEIMLMESSGSNIYEYVSEFETNVIAQAIDGFDANEFQLLMAGEHAGLKRDMSERVEGSMINPNTLHKLVDEYFGNLPNPVAANKRLQEEFLPVRMKCEVNDIPVTAVSYEYRGTGYSAYVYGSNHLVWANGAQPSEFTWKIGVVIGVILAAVAALLMVQLGGH